MRLRGKAFKDIVAKLASLESRGFAEDKCFQVEALKRSSNHLQSLILHSLSLDCGEPQKAGSVLFRCWGAL